MTSNGQTDSFESLGGLSSRFSNDEHDSGDFDAFMDYVESLDLGLFLSVTMFNAFGTMDFDDLTDDQKTSLVRQCLPVVCWLFTEVQLEGDD